MRPRLRVSPLSEEGGPGQMLGTSRLGRAWVSRFTLRKEGSQWSGDGVFAGTHFGTWEMMKSSFPP